MVSRSLHVRLVCTALMASLAQIQALLGQLDHSLMLPQADSQVQQSNSDMFANAEARLIGTRRRGTSIRRSLPQA
jgi:hypothetical protein